jgi:hypothetical protein
MWRFLRSRPECPVSEDHQEWVDGRFRWLQEQLDQDVLRDVRVILPTPEFFPDPFDNTLEAAKRMLARVAGYMGVDEARFELFQYTEGQPAETALGHQEHSGTAGLYVQDRGPAIAEQQRPRIGVETRQLGDPMLLAATLAHEIGHDILLGRQLVTRETQDHEPLTDLLTVFLGMGIFTANSTIQDRGWSSGVMAGWSTKRQGYLDQRTFGYALARFAFERGERKPGWMRHVRPDVRVAVKQGLGFLAAERESGG